MKFKKTVKNILTAFGSQFLTLAIAFLLPRLYIVSYGSEANGLLSSISQLFGYFALLEAGVGTATQQALYKYVSNQATDHINQILAATNYYYKRTGLYYFLLVIGVAVIYPVVVPIEMPFWMVTGAIMLIGSGSVINFWFQGKYRVLLTAEGKDYVNNNVAMIATTTSNVIKVVLLTMGYNIIIIQAGYLIVSAGQAIFYTNYVKKKYTWIDLNVQPDFKAIEQSKSVLIHQITSLVFNNTDVLLLTFACRDLKIVSLYTIYGLIYNNIDNITVTINSAYKPLLGQLYFQDRKRFETVFEISEVFYMAFSFALYFVAFLLTPWFIGLYTAGADISYTNFWVPFLFVSMKLLAQMRRPLLGIVDMAGHFKQTQTRTIIEMLTNLLVSIALVWKFNIYGVLMGTIVALLYRNVDVLIYVPKYLVNHNPLITVKRWFTYLVVFVLGYMIWSFVDYPKDSVIMFIISGALLSAIALVLFIGVGALSNKKATADLKDMVASHRKK